MDINPYDLVNAKFPPEQTLALLDDLLVVRELLSPTTPGAEPPPYALHPDLKKLFLEVLDALVSHKAQLIAKTKYDSVDVDRDLDDAGLGTQDILDAKEKVVTSRQVPLKPKHHQRIEDIKLIRALFRTEKASGRGIFALPFFEEWNAITLILGKLAEPNIKAAVQRLGLEDDFERLADCNQLLGILLGIGQEGTAKPEDAGYARFEKLNRKLIGALIHLCGEDTDEDRYWRQTLLGPFSRHVGLFRERRRKQEERRVQKAAQPEPAIEESTSKD